jgi:3-deoxy-manno-octulosonate cytidylyltransferase (CMP-KDO synthetase)
MKVIAVIPARYASTRFPGKPLALLRNKPMLQWVIEGVRKSQLIDELYVATDDERIAEVCVQNAVAVRWTEADCPTGTDRIYAATKNIEFDVVINVQGDEPLVGPELIDPLVQAFRDDPTLDMATLAHRLDPADLENKNVVKVILNYKKEAIYFSRFAIPYSRTTEVAPQAAMRHVGLYAYRRSFLQSFCESAPAEIEKFESLEQLRALYLGARIKVLPVHQLSLGVDTPEDLQRLEKHLERSGF